MDDNKNITHYSTAAIQKYLEGTLSAAEMHAMEKAALDDPFLADAIEGMQEHLKHSQASSFNADLESLEKRLQEKIAVKKKTVLLSPNRLWWRVAAAVIVLTGTSLLTFNYLFKNKAKQNIARADMETAVADSSIQKEEPSSSLSETADTISNSIAPERQKAPAGNKPTHSPSKKEKKLLPEKDRSDTPGYATSDKKTQAGKEKISTATIARADTVNDNTVSVSKNPPANAPVEIDNALQGKVAGVEVSARKSNNLNFFQGRVLDENKHPITGASITLKNNKNGVVTDNNGVFKLTTNSRDSVVHVNIASVGFQPASLTLKNNYTANNTIQLQPALNSLDEVVVTGLGTRKNEDTDEAEPVLSAAEIRKQKAAVQKAIPTVSLQEFNNYLNRNKRISTPDSTIKGKETISFIVNKNGDRSAFRIEKSLSPAHDAEAIRLIKNGPPWKLLSSKKARTTVTIEF